MSRNVGTNNNGWNSNFSNTAMLTTLGSLVLECQLEDAQHDSAATSFQMDPAVYARLQDQVPANQRCADCACQDDTEWASVSFGIFLCAQCSGVHRALGTHISRVRSIKMDSWSDEQLHAMIQGGNQQWHEYLQQPQPQTTSSTNAETESIAEKYSAPAAQRYKEQLAQRVKEAMAAGKPDVKTSTHATTTKNCEISSAPHDSPVKSTAKQELLDNHTSPRSPLERESNNKEASAAMTQRTKLDPLSTQSHHSPRRHTIRPQHQRYVARSSSTHSLHVGTDNTSIPTRQVPRRTKSTMSSAPTITYMGRTFRADESQTTTNSTNNNSSHHGRMIDFDALRQSLRQPQQQPQQQEQAQRRSWDFAERMRAWRGSQHERSSMGDDVDDTHNTDTTKDDYESSILRHANPQQRKQFMQQQLCRSLSFSQADLLEIACDDKEFRRLKEGLQHKGAITNQVLKQRLYAFVAKSKVRRKSISSGHDPTTRKRGIRRVKSARTPVGRNDNLRVTQVKNDNVENEKQEDDGRIE